MEIKNFEFTTKTNTKYIINGTIDHLPSSGFVLTKIDTINGEKQDSLILRQLVSHEDILKHIKKENNVEC